MGIVDQIRLAAISAAPSKKIPSNVDADKKKVAAALTFSPMSKKEIMAKTGLTPERAARAIAALSAKNAINTVYTGEFGRRRMYVKGD
jgi:DNA-binding MarR family transcriptional regulator